MAAPQVNRKARGRLATNDNETIVVAAKVNDDTMSGDELDTEAHRLAANDNETVDSPRRVDAGDDTTITSARRLADDGEEEPTAPDAARRLRR